MAKSNTTKEQPTFEWLGKRPILKVDKKDADAYLKDKSNYAELYLKYFGLDNTQNKSEQVKKAIIKDLDNLFGYAY